MSAGTAAQVGTRAESGPPRAPAPMAARNVTRWRADAVALAVVLLVGVAVRILFAASAPVLLQGDSETYLGPALDLVRGEGFDLSIKRTPGYPLLIAGVFRLWGEDLYALATVQHALGLATAALAFILTRQFAGRGAALAAGLMTALAGNLLVYERMVMTESLFATALAAAVTLLALGVQRRSWRWLLAAGLALGVAALVRPVAQGLLVLAPLALLLAGRGWRHTLVGSGVVLAGYLLVLGPWAASGNAEGGAVGALGQTLVGRTARHDRRDPDSGRGFIFYDPRLDEADPDPLRLAARRILQEAAERGSSGRAVHTRLRKELGLSEGDADRLMRDLAIQAILRRPDYYAIGTLQRFGRLWVTPAERLVGYWNDRSTIIRGWEDEASAPLLAQADADPRDLPTAEALVGLFQPARLGLAYPLLFLLGVIAALASRPARPATIPALAAAGLILVSVALVGGVARYRYPEDPLIFVVCVVGLSWALGTLRPRARRLVASAARSGAASDGR